jgi:hypothetical protein
MPFNLDDAINNTQNYFVSFPLLYKIAKNPIYLSLIITIIICLIIYIAFQNVNLKKTIKLGLLIFIVSLSLIFIQNTILLKVEKNKSISVYGQNDNYLNNINTYDELNKNDPNYQEIIPDINKKINLNNLYGSNENSYNSMKYNNSANYNNSNYSNDYNNSNTYNNSNDYYKNNTNNNIDLLSNLNNTVMNMKI